MKLLFVAFLATWTMKILSCSTIIQNGKLIRQFVEQHAEIREKTVEDILKFKYQKMEELKAEIEDLEEQKTHEDFKSSQTILRFFMKIMAVIILTNSSNMETN